MNILPQKDPAGPTAYRLWEYKCGIEQKRTYARIINQYKNSNYKYTESFYGVYRTSLQGVDYIIEEIDNTKRVSKLIAIVNPTLPNIKIWVYSNKSVSVTEFEESYRQMLRGRSILIDLGMCRLIATEYPDGTYGFYLRFEGYGDKEDLSALIERIYKDIVGTKEIYTSKMAQNAIEGLNACLNINGSSFNAYSSYRIRRMKESDMLAPRLLDTFALSIPRGERYLLYYHNSHVWLMRKDHIILIASNLPIFSKTTVLDGKLIYGRGMYTYVILDCLYEGYNVCSKYYLERKVIVERVKLQQTTHLKLSIAKTYSYSTTEEFYAVIKEIKANGIYFISSKLVYNSGIDYCNLSERSLLVSDDWIKWKEVISCRFVVNAGYLYTLELDGSLLKYSDIDLPAEFKDDIENATLELEVVKGSYRPIRYVYKKSAQTLDQITDIMAISTNGFELFGSNSQFISSYNTLVFNALLEQVTMPIVFYGAHEYHKPCLIIEPDLEKRNKLENNLRRAGVDYSLGYSEEPNVLVYIADIKLHDYSHIEALKKLCFKDMPVTIALKHSLTLTDYESFKLHLINLNVQDAIIIALDSVKMSLITNNIVQNIISDDYKIIGTTELKLISDEFQALDVEMISSMFKHRYDNNISANIYTATTKWLSLMFSAVKLQNLITEIAPVKILPIKHNISSVIDELIPIKVNTVLEGGYYDAILMAFYNKYILGSVDDRVRQTEALYNFGLEDLFNVSALFRFSIVLIDLESGLLAKHIVYPGAGSKKYIVLGVKDNRYLTLAYKFTKYYKTVFESDNDLLQRCLELSFRIPIDYEFIKLSSGDTVRKPKPIIVEDTDFSELYKDIILNTPYNNGSKVLDLLSSSEESDYQILILENHTLEAFIESVNQSIINLKLGGDALIRLPFEYYHEEALQLSLYKMVRDFADVYVYRSPEGLNGPIFVHAINLRYKNEVSIQELDSDEVFAAISSNLYSYLSKLIIDAYGL